LDGKEVIMLMDGETLPPKIPPTVSSPDTTGPTQGTGLDPALTPA